MCGGTSGGSLDGGIALARLFVSSGTLASKEKQRRSTQTIAAASGDGSVGLPTTLLIDTGHVGSCRALRVGDAREQASGA